MALIPAAVEPAVAYRSINGRRFFTRKAALKSSAWSLVKGRCDCESEPDVNFYHVCTYHRELPDGRTRGDLVVARLVRWWSRRTRRSTC